jgi:hypothetical protein
MTIPHPKSSYAVHPLGCSTSYLCPAHLEAHVLGLVVIWQARLSPLTPTIALCTIHTSISCPHAESSLASKFFAQPAFSSTKPSHSHSEAAVMERRHSVGSASAGFADFNHRGVGVRGRAREPRGSAVNYSRNPRFRPRIVFKIDNIFEEMSRGTCC